MAATLFLLSPIFIGGLALFAWAVFDHRYWHRWLSRCGWLFPALAIGLYAAGFLLSMVGDRLYRGSGEPFDWGLHYTATTPMMICGFVLAPLAFVYTLATGITYSIKRKSEQVRGANALPRAAHD